MATTAGGLPYVEPSDLVSGWPAVSQDLAETLDTQLAAKAPTASPTFTGTVTWDSGSDDYTAVRDGATGYLKFAGAQNTFSGYILNVTNGATTKTALQVDNDGYVSGSGSFGPWVAYTPTLSGGNWAIGNGTLTGAWCSMGKTVHYRATMTFGGTTVTDGTIAPIISVPFALDNSPEIQTATGLAYDASTGLTYALWPLSSTGVTVYCFQSAIGLVEAVITTKPIAWAAGDQIRISMTYERS